MAVLGIFLLTGCATPPAKVPAGPRVKNLIDKMETEIVRKVVADVREDLADIYPEYATAIGVGPMPAGWNVPTPAPLATDIYVNAYQLLERGVDPGHLADRELADVARLQFAAGLHADAVRFSAYTAIRGESPVARMAGFLVHTQPADSALRLREYISRIDQIGSATTAMLEQADPAFADAISFRNPCNAPGARSPRDGRELTVEITEDFATHLQHLDISPDARHTLIQAARAAALRAIPAACTTIDQFLRSQTRASRGAWQMADGERYYRYLLRAYTSMTQSPEDIYAMAKAGLSDSRTQPEQFADAASTGAQALLNRASDLVLDLDARLEDWSDQSPWADLDIRAMPAYLARDCACTARYYPGTPTSPVATVYLNTLRLPDSRLAATIAANTIPGRHLIAAPEPGLEIEIPAYSDGWAAYSTLLGGEDSGSRAVQRDVYARAAADVGIHFLRWQPDEAIRFLEEQNPASAVPAPEIVEAILLNPARAASAAVGLHWFKLARQRSAGQLSDKEYNNLVLANGPVPFSALEDTLIRRLQAGN